MNKTYRLVWCSFRNAWIAVSELSKSKTKSSKTRTIGSVIAAGLMLTFSAGAFAYVEPNDICQPNPAPNQQNTTNSFYGQNIVCDWNTTYSTFVGNNITAAGNGVNLTSVGNNINTGGKLNTAIGSSIISQGRWNTAVGNNLNIVSEHTNAFGNNISATGLDSTFIGSDITAVNTNNTNILGNHITIKNTTANSEATRDPVTDEIIVPAVMGGTILGNNIGVTDSRGVTVTGDSNTVTASNGISIFGPSNIANNAPNSTIIGRNNQIQDATTSTVIGLNSKITGRYDSVALGNQVTIDNAVAGIGVGVNAYVASNFGTAIGNSALVDNSSYAGTAIGNFAKVQQSAFGTALGNAATVSNSYASQALGSKTSVTDSNRASAIGDSAKVATSSDALAAGSTANVANSGRGTAIGYSANVQNSFSSNALGSGAKVFDSENSNAVGNSAVNSSKRATAVGNSANITSSSDALATGATANVVNSERGTAVGFAANVQNGFASNALGSGAKVFDSTNATSVGNATISSNSNFSTAVGNSAKVTSSVNAGAYGQNASVTNSANSTALGQNAIVNNSNSAMALGQKSLVDGSINASAVGYGSQVINNSIYSQAFGASNIIDGSQYSTAVGKSSTITASNNASLVGTNSKIINASNYSQAFGTNNIIDGSTNATGVGVNTKISASNNAVAMGNGANVASAKDGIAIGTNANVTVANSVALGAGSTATLPAESVTTATVRPYTYTGFAGTSPVGVVSVGSAGKERQITNVAAGRISTTSTDAINGSQLYATQFAIGNLANSTANIIGTPVTVNPDGTLTSGNIGGTTKNNVSDAINEVRTTPLNFAGNSGSVSKKLGETLSIVGGLAVGAPATAANTRVDVVNGQMVVNMAKDLTDLTSVTTTGPDGTTVVNGAGLTTTDVDGNTTVVNGSGLTITDPDGNAGPSITIDGIDAGNLKVTNVAPGEISADSKDAVNGSQLFATEQKGLNFTDSNGTVTHKNLGETLGIIGGGTKADSEYSATNIKTTTDADGNIVVNMDKNLTDLESVTTADAAGNTSVLNGEGLTATDAAGNNTVVNGSGLTITNADGSTGPSITTGGIDAGNLKVTNVAPGEISADSKDAVNGSQLYQTTDELTKLGLNFAGNTGTDIHKNLGETLSIVGGLAEGAPVTSANTRVDEVDGQLVVNMAKDLTDLTSVTTTDAAGNTTVMNGEGVTATDVAGNSSVLNGSGLTINNADGTTGPSITTGGIDAGNLKVTNVAPGEISADSKDAVNGGQLYATEQKGLNFAGNTGDDIHKALGETLTIKGGLADTAAATDANTRVDSEDGNLVVKMAKDLTDLTSVTTTDADGNSTVVNGSGLTITNADGSTGPSITTGGIDAGNLKVTNVADGTIAEGSKDAVNGGQLYQTANELKDLGLNFADSNGVVTHKNLGETLGIIGGGTKEDSNYSASNVKTTTDADGNIVVMLDKNLNADSLTINGKDGVDGAPGTPGFTLSGATGPAGVNGLPGETTTRIVYDDGTGPQEVATLNDGLKFAGNQGDVINKKLNETLTVQGGLDNAADATDANTRVDSENGNLVVKMAKDLTDLTSVTTTDADGNSTVVNGSGLTITNADGSTGPSITTGGIDAGNLKVTNVAPGEIAKDSLDAVNGGQLYQTTEELTNKGLNFAGNTGTDIHKALGETLSIVGGLAAGAPATDANTRVDSVDGQLVVNMAKDLTDLTSVTTTDASGNTSVLNGAGLTSTDFAGNKTVVNGAGVATKDAAGNSTVMNGNGLVSTDFTGNKTVINGSGLTVVNKDGSTGPSITNTGIDAGGLKVTNVADGEISATSKDAVNGSQLHQTTVDLTNQGLNFADSNGNVTHKNLGDTLGIIGGGTKADSDYSASNVKTTTDENGNIVVMLDKNLNADSLTINGKDGVDGAPGTPGFTLAGATGPAGVNGAPGETTTRIVYDDGTGPQEVATLNDGLKFAGNQGDVIAKKLNETLTVKGGLDNSADASDANLRVDSEDGNLVVKMAKDLTDLNSITLGNTVLNQSGLTIGNPDGSTGPSITTEGINAGGLTITNVAPGVNGTDAVNVDQLNSKSDELTNLGLNFVDNNGTVTHKNLGETLGIVGGGTKADSEYSSSNIKTTTDADGNVVVMMDKNLNADSLVLNGKDGVDGQPGTPGLTITGATGPAGVNGAPGETTTRIVYDDGTGPQQVATLNDGLKFAGNQGDVIAKKLNETLTVKGGLDNDADASDANLRVDSEDGNLVVKMAKDLTDINSVTLGNTVLNQDGLTVGGANGPSITTAGINAGGTTITNVAAGQAPTDAVNVSQLKDAAAAATTEVKAADGDKNVSVTSATADDGHTIYSVGVSRDLNVDSVTLPNADGSSTNLTAGGLSFKDADGNATGPSVTANGIDAGDEKITNVAAGDISADSKDAVNGSQLYGLGNNITNIFGGNASYAGDQIVWNNIGGTGQNTIDDAIKYVNDQAANANQGWNIATDSGTANTSTVKPGDTVNINGDTASGVTVTNNGNNITVGLSDKVNVGDKVSIDGTTGTINAGNVTINGEAGTVNGLTNTTWNPDNIVSGQAATEDQLAQVAQNASNQAAASKTEVTQGNNIVVTSSTADDGHTVYNVATADDVKFNSVDATTVTAGSVSVGNVTIDQNGINAGGQKVTNVAPGTVSSTSTDAVNGSQLYTTNQNIANYLGGGSTVDANGNTTAPTYNVSGGSYNNVGDALGAIDNRVTTVQNNLEQAFSYTNNRINKLEDKMSAGIAATAALENAPYVPGKWTYAAGAAYYNDQSAVGVTLRRTADNGRWSLNGGVAGGTTGSPLFRIGVSGVID